MAGCRLSLPSSLLLLVMLTLLLPCCVLSSLLIPSATTRQIEHRNSTQGKSGPRCTKIGRRCLRGIACRNRKCVCPPGQKGWGTMECIDKDNLLCMVTADPHALTYGDAHANVNLPCRYRLTRFIADHVSPGQPHARCSLEVFAINELSQGWYYVHGLHVTVGVGDPSRQRHDVFEIHKYGTSENTVYRYLSNINHTHVVWGSSLHEEIQGVSVFPVFDLDNNFAVLHVPQCGIRVKYRAFDPKVRRQYMLPGISVMAPYDAIFTEGYGTYPESLCGVKNDSDDLFKARARELGLKNKDLAVIYDILDQASHQRGNPKHKECRDAFNAFKASENKVEDLNVCGRILNDHKLRKCIVYDYSGGLEPIQVFTACFRFRQTRAVADCTILRRVRADCGKVWKIPDKQLPSCAFY